MIDTRRVKDRRTLRFETLDELQGEVNHLADLERAGKLQHLGNWTLGQTFGHMAAWIEFAYDGYPIQFPAMLRFMIRPLRRRFLYKSMRSGARIPKVPNGTAATDSLTLNEGLARITQSIDRLKHQPPTHPSPMLGRLNHDEYISLHLRHGEMHLSFFKSLN